jgi:hypothetical protein
MYLDKQELARPPHSLRFMKEPDESMKQRMWWGYASELLRVIIERCCTGGMVLIRKLYLWLYGMQGNSRTRAMAAQRVEAPGSRNDPGASNRETIYN